MQTVIDALAGVTPETIEGAAGTAAAVIIAIGAAVGRIRRAVVEACKRAARRGGGGTASTVLAALVLSGCGAIPTAVVGVLGVAGGAAVEGLKLYCVSTSEDARQDVRAAVTGGTKLFACPDKAGEGS